MIRRGDRKGSHVGVIASFAIFVMFLIGIFFVVQPALKTQKDKEILLELAEKKLMNEFKNNLTTLIIVPSATNCTQIHWQDYGLPWFGTTGAPIVRNISGEFKEIDFLTDFYLRPTPESLLFIKASLDFVPYVVANEVNFLSTCPGQPNPNYHIAEAKSIRVEKRIFESRIINGINNFNNLKQIVSLPEGNDISITFLMANGSVYSAGDKNILTNVFSKEISINYVTLDGRDNIGRLIIKVW